jgi:hypothetical protein
MSAAIGVHISEIDPGLKPASQMREAMSAEAIEEYGKRLAAMPPVKLMFDPKAGMHWVIDGAHTITAAVACKQADIAATIETGSYEDAWRKASHENETHGVRRTTADRHASLVRAREQWPGKSSRWYADMCNVAHVTVQRVLGDMHSQVEQCSTSGKVEGKDGKQYPATKDGKDKGDGKDKKPVQPAKVPFICGQCGEEFTSPVWHCHLCGEHWPNSDNVCPRCQPADAGEDEEDEPEVIDSGAGGIATATRPSIGLLQARRAIYELEQITANDRERNEAFNQVRRWIDERQA